MGQMEETTLVPTRQWEAAQEVILAGQGVLDGDHITTDMLKLARAIGYWEGVYNG